jgi:hypothetical protein
MRPVPHSTHLFRTRPFAVVVALALLLAACGGGGKAKTKAQPTVTTRPKVLAVKTSVLKVESVNIQTAGPSVPIDTPTGRAVLGVAQRYIDEAVFAPLKTGNLGGGFPTLFEPALRANATGADKPALTDIAVGKVTNLSTTATPVRLSALEGPLGELMYVATVFDLTAKATAGTGRLSIQRHVELTFAKTGSAWRVTAYRVRAIRKSAAGTTTTTAKGGATP